MAQPFRRTSSLCRTRRAIATICGVARSGDDSTPRPLPGGPAGVFHSHADRSRDLVLDPFAGSCVTGEIAERLDRKWVCVELLEDYVKGALGRFEREPGASGKPVGKVEDQGNYYRVPRPGILWNGAHGDPLAADGGAKRRLNGSPRTTSPIVATEKAPRQRSVTRKETQQ